MSETVLGQDVGGSAPTLLVDLHVQYIQSLDKVCPLFLFHLSLFFIPHPLLSLPSSRLFVAAAQRIDVG